MGDLTFLVLHAGFHKSPQNQADIKSKNELKIPCLKRKKAVWEAGLSLGDLRGKFSRCSQPTRSQGVNSQGGDSLAAAT